MANAAEITKFNEDNSILILTYIDHFTKFYVTLSYNEMKDILIEYAMNNLMASHDKEIVLKTNWSRCFYYFNVHPNEVLTSFMPQPL